MPSITVFTPTYNRSKLLSRAYRALCRQTTHDFDWLVVDDGSTDNTRELIEALISQETRFQIRYVYKENGGLQTGYVEALRHITSDLCFCVDSDDYLLDDAIATVREFWQKHGSDKYAGILALDQIENGEIIGGLYPEDCKEINLVDLDLRKKVYRPKVDRILIIRSSVYKTAQPAIKYPGETSINATYLHLQISGPLDFLIMNRAVCVVEYQQDGMSNIRNKIIEYSSSPNTYFDWRIFILSHTSLPIKIVFVQSVHLVAESILAKRNFFKETPRKVAAVISIPFGIVLWVFIKLKSR